MKPHLLATLAFASGFFTHWTLVRVQRSTSVDIDHHWSLVNEFNDFMRNAGNYSPDSRGLVSATLPYDPKPSLAALVAADELTYVNIVIPTVPNNVSANRHWMQFVQKRSDVIVYATGNPQYTNYEPRGDVPLHLQLWFKDRASANINQLISELEALPESRK